MMPPFLFKNELLFVVKSGRMRLRGKVDVCAYGALAVANPLHAKSVRLSCGLSSNPRCAAIALFYGNHTAHTSLQV